MERTIVGGGMLYVQIQISVFMKKIFRFVPLMAAMAAFTACSDDDNNTAENFTPSPATDITAQIDPVFAQEMQEKGYIKNAERILYGDVKDLKIVDVGGNPLTGGDITSLKGVEFLTELERLTCNFNKLTEIDLTHNPDLKELNCDANQLTSLDLNGNPDLEILKCARNAIATLDLRSNPDAEFVMCGENRLTSVDVSRCQDLVQLQCENNLLSSLDVSANRKLNLLNFEGNPGDGTTFAVKAWFDEASVPANFTSAPWQYDGATVTPVYSNAVR